MASASIQERPQVLVLVHLVLAYCSFAPVRILLETAISGVRKLKDAADPDAVISWRLRLDLWALGFAGFVDPFA